MHPLVPVINYSLEFTWARYGTHSPINKSKAVLKSSSFCKSNHFRPEVLQGYSPFAGTKRGAVQRGRKWNEISERLLQVEAPRFKVDQRGVRERYGLLAKAYRKKIREEERASGISTPELTEVEQALEDLIVREPTGDSSTKEEDKKDAEEVRKRAMERLGDENEVRMNEKK